jgi:hypothetical protein
MTQNILIIPADAVVADYIAMAQENNCVGILRGVPASLQALADEEGWILPHIYAEPIPQPVTPDNI